MLVLYYERLNLWRISSSLEEIIMPTAADELRREGLLQGKMEVARKLLLKGSDIKTIMEITNLSKEEIQKIKGNLE